MSVAELSESPIRHRPWRSFRLGFTLVELMVVVAIIGVLVALLLPAVSSAREAARRAQCTNQLKQMGIGLHGYHEVMGAFPSGYMASMESGFDGKSWGWAAALLPFIEYRPLADQLDISNRSIDEVAEDELAARLLQQRVDLFICPSDAGNELSHRYRSIFVTRVMEPTGGRPGSSARGMLLGHIYIPPDPEPDPEPDPDPVFVTLAVKIAKSNYVGSSGSQWKRRRTDWEETDFEGNGLFGRNSEITISKIQDGTSKTLAVGERCLRNYAAVWAGGNSWQGCGFGDNQMVLGTAFYPINDRPINQNVDCDGRGSANFSSYHNGGSNFLFADGSVHFLSESIDSQPSGGVFQNLAQRDDGEIIGDF